MQRALKNKTAFRIGVVLVSFAVFVTSFPALAIAQNASANQAAAFNNGVTSGGNNGGAGGVAGSAGSCIASNILSNGVSSTITSALGSLGGGAEDSVNSVIRVGTHNPTLQDKQEVIKQAQVGFTIPFTNTLIGVGWDGVAWCITNSLIEYVANTTIKWANSGFNGSPAFIDNMDNFLENLADQEAGTFINTIARDIKGGGINLCSNFKVSVSIGLSNYYSKGGNYRNTSSCTLTKVVGNIDKFMNGNFQEGGWAGWFSMTQNPQNNRIGATIMATDELYARISAKNNTAKFELGLNNGFLNYTKCTEPGNKKSCKTLTPGTVIQSSLEKSLGLPKDRLVIAQKFDQVISAVVENLIKVALNEVLTSSK